MRCFHTQRRRQISRFLIEQLRPHRPTTTYAAIPSQYATHLSPPRRFTVHHTSICNRFQGKQQTLDTSQCTVTTCCDSSSSLRVKHEHLQHEQCHTARTQREKEIEEWKPKKHGVKLRNSGEDFISNLRIADDIMLLASALPQLSSMMSDLTRVGKQ